MYIYCILIERPSQAAFRIYLQYNVHLINPAITALQYCLGFLAAFILFQQAVETSTHARVYAATLHI